MLTNHNTLSKLPKWAYLPLLILLIIGAAGTIYLTRDYAVSNLILLKLDNASRASRQLSIDVLLYIHVIALFITPILFDPRLKWRRRQFLALGLAIWLFDCATLYQSRVGIIIAGDSQQKTELQHVTDIRDSIKSLRDSAAGMRASAARQAALDRIKASAEDQREAARLEAKAAALADKLADAPAGTGLTEVSVWGDMAKYKALVESLLISGSTLGILGLIGAIMRVMFERVAPDVERAAVAMSRPGSAPAKRGLGRLLRGALAALGIGAAAASASASAAPVAPAAPMSQSDDVPDVPTSGQAGVPTSGQQAAQVKAAKTVKTAKPRVQKEAAVRDTGTVGKSAGRYELVKAGVIAGTIKPSIRGIQAAEGGSKEVVGRYIKQLAADGVIVPSGRGYALKGGAK
jgi:hypothetical protein